MLQKADILLLATSTTFIYNALSIVNSVDTLMHNLQSQTFNVNPKTVGDGQR